MHSIILTFFGTRAFQNCQVKSFTECFSIFQLDQELSFICRTKICKTPLTPSGCGCCCPFFFFSHARPSRMWIKSNIQWLELMSNAWGKGMNWGGRVEHTESRHENIMKKSEKSILFISNLIHEGTWEIKLTSIFFSALSLAFLQTLVIFYVGCHHVKSERIHDKRRWWERKYEIIRWIRQGQIYQLAGMVEYVRVARTSDAVEKRWKCWKSLPQLTRSPVSLALDLEFW